MARAREAAQVWLGAHGLTFGRFRLSHGGWLVSSRGGCKVTRHEAIYVLHAFEKQAQKTGVHGLRIGQDRFQALRKLGQIP